MIRQFDRLPDAVRLEEVRPYFESLSKKRFQLFLKRLFDIAVALIVLVVLLLGGFAFVFLNSKPSEQNPSAPSVADVSAASAAQAESSISSSETALPESRPDASSAASTTVSATSEAESSAPEVVLDSTQNIRVEASGNTAVLTLQHCPS